MDYQDKEKEFSDSLKENGTQPGTESKPGEEIEFAPGVKIREEYKREAQTEQEALQVQEAIQEQAKAQARDLLGLLFNDYFKQYNGFIEILNKRIGQKYADKPLYFKTLPYLLGKIETLTGDVWFGVAPRDLERAYKTAITYITCLWTDIDVGTEGHKAPGYFKNQDDALKVIDDFQPKPSIIVSSGYGLHLYWLLKTSIIDLDTAEETLKGIAKTLQGEKWERTSLLRLPGTYNCKVSESPKECKILSKNDLRYELKDFDNYRVIGLKEFESKEVIFNKTAPGFAIEDLYTNKIAPEILALIKTGDTKGKYLKENGTGRIDRSERDQAVILELLNTGHSPEAIRGLFINKDYSLSEKYYEMGARGDYYLARSIENAQRFLDSGVIEEKGKKLIIPKDADSLLMKALRPDFPYPLLIERDGQQLLTLSYENKLTDTDVTMYINKDLLKKYNITEDDFKYREMTWEGYIAQYLIDKKARTGKERIEGSIEEIAKYICRGKPRQEDYKKVEVNLKSLAIRQYIVKHEDRNVTFIVINPLDFNETTKYFIVGLSELVPKILGEAIGAKQGTLYINKSQKEFYPKQRKYDYNIRNYFSRIKNITKDIPQINGITLLEISGYLADIAQGKKKYRNTEAQSIINKFTKIGAKEYGLLVNCYKQDLMLKDVRKRTYNIKISDKRMFIRQDKAFRDTLANWFYKQPGNQDLQICINRAQGLFNSYGVAKVKKVFLGKYQKPGFTIGELEKILIQGSKRGVG